MPIDFHDEKNKSTYATRSVAKEWMDFIEKQVDIKNKIVADIGCGGGIYSRAWAELGAKNVIGIDFSEHMVKTAREKSIDYPQTTFQQGNAEKTGLASSSIDLVFERALIHHLVDYNNNFQEIHRVLSDKGYFIIQDRTMENVTLPGGEQHLRGFFFECFPKLIDVEAKRRPTQKQVETELQQNGFKLVSSQVFCETRRIYDNFSSLEQDISARTGRSILHELDDNQITFLVNTLRHHLSHLSPIIEQDYWHIWVAQKNRWFYLLLFLTF
nr:MULTISPECIES: class I SAM-dependent methyltransferase [Providencia]